MEEFIEKVTKWLEAELVPQMLKDGDLGFGSEARLVSVQARPLEVTGFALTTPFKVHVEVTEEGRSFKLNLVVKKTPPMPKEMYEGAQFEQLFQNETVAYKEILPIFTNAKKYPRLVPETFNGELTNLIEMDFVQVVIGFYQLDNNNQLVFYSSIQALDAVLVMDDFSQYGWKMSNSIYDLSLDHILCAAIELGKFHGECYVIKETKPDVFNGIVSKMHEARYTKMDQKWAMMLSASAQRAIDAAKREYGDEIPDAFLTALHGRLKDAQSFGLDSIRPLEPLAVITHGDYLRNNVAFRYTSDDPTQKPTEAMMFDMQTMRFCSPMLDLSTLLANSCQAEVRKPNLETILRTYFDALMGVLRAALKDKVPSYYSFENFHKEYAVRASYGLHIAAGFLPCLYEPFDVAAMMAANMTPEEILAVILAKGGAVLNRELASQVREIYHLHQKLGLTI